MSGIRYKTEELQILQRYTSNDSDAKLKEFLALKIQETKAAESTNVSYSAYKEEE